MDCRRCGPTTDRSLFLDALRGFALLGVCLANYPEFSLYSFLPDDLAGSLPSARVDSIFRFFQLMFVDGKFYTLFSLLFGVGFSIIIGNAMKRGANGMKIFYRRMFILVIIGLSHLLTVWSGDILLLYALMGMILPVFRKVSMRRIVLIAVGLLLLPVVVEAICMIFVFDPARYPYEQWWVTAEQYGITVENFHTWLRDADSYSDVHSFLMQGAWERMWEFVDSSRYFKVLGLFMIGYAIGRNRIYLDLDQRISFLKNVAKWGLVIGLPVSLAYTVNAMSGHPYGRVFDSLLYAAGVYTLGVGYAALLAWMFCRNKHLLIWRLLAAPGRMALTNYIGQSVVGMFLFYGIGLGLGASMGLAQTELVALGVFIVLSLFSYGWLKVFRFGPIEWIWRMLTYGRWFSIK